MSNHMPDSITRALLAALNAADELCERNSDFAKHLAPEAVPVAKALVELAMQVTDIADDRQNRFAATICLSMDKFRSVS